MRKKSARTAQPLRFAVIGLGHIAQAAVLPAFRHARRHVELAALVSGTPAKLKALGKRYGVKLLASYAEADKLFDSGAIDAVYVATPNTEHTEWVLPDFRYNEALSFIKQGLQDISLSRVRISWGVQVPWEPSQVFYVWFDALLNYYTALTYAPGASIEEFWPPSVQLLAKDILKFHAVIWPALLMAADLPLPKQLYIHGYLLMDEHKMSKSLGNVIDPFQIIDKFGTDALRFYLMREVSFGQDGNVSTEGFENRYTTELANEYGNLASRTLAMIDRYRDGNVAKAGDADVTRDRRCIRLHFGQVLGAEQHDEAGSRRLLVRLERPRLRVVDLAQ